MTLTELRHIVAVARERHFGRAAVKSFAAPVPSRRVALAWRASFPRRRAVEAVRQAVLASKLPGITPLPDAAPAGD